MTNLEQINVDVNGTPVPAEQVPAGQVTTPTEQTPESPYKEVAEKITTEVAEPAAPEVDAATVLKEKQELETRLSQAEYTIEDLKKNPPTVVTTTGDADKAPEVDVEAIKSDILADVTAQAEQAKIDAALAAEPDEYKRQALSGALARVTVGSADERLKIAGAYVESMLPKQETPQPETVVTGGTTTPSETQTDSFIADIESRIQNQAGAVKQS